MRRIHHTITHHGFTALITLLKSLMNSLVWILIALAGFIIFQKSTSPYNVLFGLPTFLISVGVVGNALGTALLAIFSRGYNRGVCQLCNK